MPIYEYQCEKCDHRLEIMQKVSDKLLTKCPKCDQNGLKRCISLTSFRLKGKGWYQTDFKENKQTEVKPEKPATQDTKPAIKEKSDKSKE
ncbi:MAG: zinc ribbon domain-containing protein [Pseudomonadota bacterium]